MRNRVESRYFLAGIFSLKDLEIVQRSSVSIWQIDRASRDVPSEKCLKEQSGSIERQDFRVKEEIRNVVLT